MKRRLSKVIKSESGQALPIVLVLLVLGGLLVAPCLSYAATSLNSGGVIEKNTKGLYAADAGIEDALWKLKTPDSYSYPYHYELADVNGLSVTVLIDQITTLWGIVVGTPGRHFDWLEVDGSMAYNEGLSVYVYTVTVTNKSNSTVKISELFVKLPPNFEYITGPTGGDLTPDTTDDPEVQGDPDTGITLVWDFPTPHPSIAGAPDPENGVYTTASHTFQLNGPPGYSGDDGYAWVVATDVDIGCVGEANAFKITAKAKEGDTTVITVKAGVLRDNVTGELLVSCWEINPPPAGN